MAAQHGKWVGLVPDKGLHFGFCYLIVNQETGQKYIGKKQLYRRSGKVKTPPTTNPTSPKWKDHHWKESDWKNYTSSSKYVNEEIKARGLKAFTFEIISLHASKAELHYAEIDWQVSSDCLRALLPSGEREYYNRNIAGVKFIPPDYYSEETRQKMSEARRELLHGRADQEVYTWVNKKTKEEVKKTCYELREMIQCSSGSLGAVISGTAKSVKGWYLKSKGEPVFAIQKEGHHNFNPTEYLWEHKVEEREERLTCYAFKEKYGGDPYAVVKGRQKSTTGWFLIVEDKLLEEV